MTRFLTSDFGYSVTDLIRSANSTIEILSYVFNCNLKKKSDLVHLIFIELKKFVSRGHTVTFICDFPRLHKPNYHTTKFFTRRFKESGFNVYYLHSSFSQHSKLLLFDRRVAILGSHNLTTRSVISPYDTSLFFDDPVLVSTVCSYYDSVLNKSVRV